MATDPPTDRALDAGQDIDMSDSHAPATNGDAPPSAAPPEEASSSSHLESSSVATQPAPAPPDASPPPPTTNGATPAPLSQPAPSQPQPSGMAPPARSATPTVAPQQAQTASALPPLAPIPPVNPAGSPTRVYINSRVTPALLEGMKSLAINEPEKPLQWLGEFLLRKSKELEGT